MIPGKIRPLAICVFRNGKRILVAEGYDPSKDQVFYRPLGGAIEFGETGRETIGRELREEMRAEVTDLQYLAAVENIFTYNGQKGHEIILVYQGAFADKSIYDLNWIEGREDDGEPFTAVWKSLTDFRDGQAPLYPDGLLELLERGDSSLRSE